MGNARGFNQFGAFIGQLDPNYTSIDWIGLTFDHFVADKAIDAVANQRGAKERMQAKAPV
jgi:hypothetical protein